LALFSASTTALAARSLPPERLVDVEQHLLLPLGQVRGGDDGVGQGAAFALLEDPGLDVQGLGRDPQTLGDLLQDLRARLAQAPLDLAEVRVRHARELRQLPQRNLRRAALLADVLADVAAEIGHRLVDGLVQLCGTSSIRIRRYAEVLAVASALLAIGTWARPQGYGEVVDLAANLRDELVDSLHAAGVLTDPRWSDAFRAVPRHVFLPGFFVQRHDGTWTAVTSDDPSHLSLVYDNQVCVTQLNGSDAAWEQALTTGAVRGIPTSSSSMPTIMAIMLEALDVAEGRTVLEIGTGTGYNAALLTHVLGPDAVTTIDVDPGVLSRAAARLKLAGYEPHCVAGDGELGHAPRAPYDRVLGTCAVSRIPRAWIDQTAPGGQIVTTLNRSIGAGLVRLTVADGVATGRVLLEDGRFMPLRAHSQAWADAALANAETAAPHETRTTLLPARAVVDPASGFEFFAGLALSDVAVGWDPMRLVHPDGSWVRHRGAVVDQGGPRALWTEAEAAHRQWRELRKPRRHDFSFTAGPTGQHFTLDGTDLTWPL
jgi:methyltransferase of ATP-grasp peptide maturase system